MTTAVINFKTDAKLKQKANKIFSSIGMDMTTGLNLYLSQVAVHNTIPFAIHTPQSLTANGYTEEFEQEILRDVADAKANGKRYNSYREMMKDIEMENHVQVN
jgi:DNA-damage-inducible protein J